ncbi:SMI1/KNR4 family protein [Corynebacterium hansenii]|uniref:SMI1/KNR4 family protein n=1 Tax=Corynebacterium hansenii TaxID=394964 RepID=A0ABV7ZP21_9CORY|nr:SMI1/KNR4 family protein [Corynebacterium hansenii]WJZ00893.1 SMI1 / KNR4 family protein [Corynebacterium hansenii]
MDPNTLKKLEIYFGKNPRFAGKPASDADIAHAESTLGLKFNDEYEQLIRNFGGCIIGIDVHAFENSPIQGRETVIELTEWFRESWPDAADESHLNYFAISDDGSGNEILMKAGDNRIFIFYHDSGSTEVLFDSLEDMINACGALDA